MSKHFFASLIYIVTILHLSPAVAVTAVTAPKVDSVSDLGYPIIVSNKIATYDGFDYELWTQKSSDDVSMTLTGGGTFQCSWDAENVLFRIGKKLGSTMTYEKYGSIIMEYAAEQNITSGDVNYLCVYGWTENPMIEYYIIETHGSYKPPGGVGFQGTYEMDGSTYEVYVNTRIEQPSIQGTKTFEQYFAVRTDKRTEGTIFISEHFKEWEKMELDMSGMMYEVALCVEGYNSSGNVNVYNHLMTVGDIVYGTPAVLSSDSDGNEETLASGETADADGVIGADGADGADQPAAPDAADIGEVKDNNYIFIIIIVLGVVSVGAGIIVIAVKSGRR